MSKQVGRVKILHIIKSLGRGGAEMLLPETLKLHDQSLYEFEYIYFLPWKDQIVKSIIAAGGVVTCFPARNNLQIMLQARKVAEFVRERKFVLIHAHLPWAGVLARLVGKITGVPVVYTEHNKQERYHWATRFMNLRTMGWTSKIICVSKDVEESIKKVKPKIINKLITVPNGVNTGHFSVEAVITRVREELGITHSAPVVGTVAVFRIQKRLDLWLEVASEIIKQFPDAHFVLVGDGPLKNELISKAGQLNLTGRVHFVGLQADVRPYLAAFNLYMISSLFEGLPIALLEAMAMNVPVVSTDAGGIKEVVRDGEEGLLCPVENPMALAALAIEMLSDKKTLLHRGESARKRVETSFGLERMVSALELIYQQELQREKGV